MTMDPKRPVTPTPRPRALGFFERIKKGEDPEIVRQNSMDPVSMELGQSGGSVVGLSLKIASGTGGGEYAYKDKVEVMVWGSIVTSPTPEDREAAREVLARELHADLHRRLNSAVEEFFPKGNDQ